MLYVSKYDSPIGTCFLVSDEKALIGLWFEGQKYFQDSIKGETLLENENDVIQKEKEWLDDYFAGKCPAISEIPLAPRGSAFRQAVWKYLCEIPSGETTTYGEIAEKVAKDFGREHMSAQAVGGAVGHNPISVIIPCHRVIGKDGSLTGYAGGIEKKRMLLKLEGLDVTKWRDTNDRIK